MRNGILGQQSNVMRRAVIYIVGQATPGITAHIYTSFGLGYNITGKLNTSTSNSFTSGGSTSVGTAGIDQVTFSLSADGTILSVDNSTVETICNLLFIYMRYNDTGTAFTSLNSFVDYGALKFELFNSATKNSWVIASTKIIQIDVCWLVQSST